MWPNIWSVSGTFSQFGSGFEEEWRSAETDWPVSSQNLCCSRHWSNLTQQWRNVWSKARRNVGGGKGNPYCCRGYRCLSILSSCYRSTFPYGRFPVVQNWAVVTVDLGKGTTLLTSSQNKFLNDVHLPQHSTDISRFLAVILLTYFNLTPGFGNF